MTVDGGAKHSLCIFEFSSHNRKNAEFELNLLNYLETPFLPFMEKQTLF